MYSFVQKSVTSVKSQNGRSKTKFSVTKGKDGIVHQIEGKTSSNNPNNILVHEKIRKMNRRTGIIRASNRVFKMKSSDIMKLLKESEKSKEPVNKRVVKAKKILDDTKKINNKRLEMMKVSKTPSKKTVKKTVSSKKDVKPPLKKSVKKRSVKKSVKPSVSKKVVKNVVKK
jgi:hypothetical protein